MRQVTFNKDDKIGCAGLVFLSSYVFFPLFWVNLIVLLRRILRLLLIAVDAITIQVTLN
jgi:hypothetical protein